MLGLFGDKVLKKACVACSVQGDEPDESSQNKKFVEELRKLSHVCFY